jgi:hypothetical protein
MSSMAPKKTCGSCTECCKIMAVPELNKPSGTTCSHCDIGKGCQIYSGRPLSCRRFMCGWLLDPNMGLNLRPDNCHVVFYQLNERDIVGISDADFPEAWRVPHVMEFIRYLAGTLGADRKVLIKEKDQVWQVSEQAIVPVQAK